MRCKDHEGLAFGDCFFCKVEQLQKKTLALSLACDELRDREIKLQKELSDTKMKLSLEQSAWKQMEKENKALKQELKMMKEITHLKDTGIPRCQTCKKDFIKVDKYTWKPACEHAKKLRLSIG